jgi:FKBP-type peptidyl-prolyl cis-trans isomerase FklB
MSWLRRVAATGALAPLLACQGTPGAQPPATPEERFSYALGARLGDDLRKSSHTLDREQVLRGVEDGLAGTPAFSGEEIDAALKQGVEQRQQQQAALHSEAALAAEREGREFLARNRARPGVVELPSGLQYEVLREGSGPVPGPEDFVTCHYLGTLLDGTAFDDTRKRGAPRSFQVTSVIDGFEEALLRMPAGSRWKLFVPAELGYGERGAGHRIPPNAVLLFEVELLEVRAAAN